MKLSRHAFTRFWDVHAWAGVIAGLALHLMFLTGAVTLFREPLARWEEPRLQPPPPAGRDDGPGAVFERAFEGGRPLPHDLWMTLPGEGEPPRVVRLDYSEPDTGERRALVVDAQTGRLGPQREGLSAFLHGVHFLSHRAVPWLMPFAGLLAVALLLAIVTGVLIHLKDIARQFHQFRHDRKKRVLFSDLHKVLGTMGLPFQAMYAYTGAYIVLLPYLLGAFTGPVFGGDEARAAEAAWGFSWPVEAGEGERVPSLPVGVLFERALAAAPGLHADSVAVHRHGRTGGFVEVRGLFDDAPQREGRVRVRAADGQVLWAHGGRERDAGDGLRAWVNGLHFVRFRGLVPRALYFVLAIAGCVTILTGNLVWLARREAKAQHLANRLLAWLTVGFGAGSVVAVAAIFAASRALPFEQGGRMALEERIFVAALGLCVAWAFASRGGRSLWGRQLGLAGGLLIATPLLAARRSTAGLFGGGEMLAEVVGVDAALLAAGAALCLTSWAIVRTTQRGAEAGETADGPATRPAAGEPATQPAAGRATGVGATELARAGRQNG